MARLAIETQAAPAAPGPTETRVQEIALLILAACAMVAVLNPGILLGAAFVGIWLWLDRPSTTRRLTCALLLVAPVVTLHTFIVWAWPWHEAVGELLSTQTPSGDASTAFRSLYVEALLGPLWFELAHFAVQLRRRTVQAQVRHDHRLDRRRWRAISGHRSPMLPDPQTLRSDSSLDHPPDQIRLGVDAEAGRPLDLDLPEELSAHVFLPGASGSGKTTTLTRIADGALANGYGVVIVDCKAGGLGHAARKLAKRYSVPFYLVDPDEPKSLGYDPCAGDAPSVANKLVGAFTYGPAAEIYKNIAMEAVPVVVRGLLAAKEPVTLKALYDAFAPRGMTNIAHKLDPDDPIRERLLDLGEPDGDKTGSSGRAGLRHRLGALREGKFGALFEAKRKLDWEHALAEPSVTYIALSALASDADVELMGRVVAQDLKQVCARRLRKIGAGAKPVPVLAIFDEFAALKEADQLADLLLQARQALMSLVISTQYLPLTPQLRKACLGAGLLIVHRIEAEDSEPIAQQFGTRRGTELTHQIDYQTGFSDKGSAKRVDKYNVNPNEFRSFRTGQAALKSVHKGNYTIVQVYPDD